MLYPGLAAEENVDRADGEPGVEGDDHDDDEKEAA
jgi:hypothetical protein